MRIHVRKYAALFTLALLLSGCAGRTELQKYEKQMLYFDTVISISFYAGENGDRLMEHCVQMCSGYEKIFSRTDGASELYAVNHRTEQKVKVSPEIAELVTAGLEYYEKSAGRFDITVAPLSDLWDFKSETPSVPADEEVKEAAAAVDASKVHLEGDRLVFDSEQTMLDLGALAKGYAADRLKEYLESEGVRSGLIDLGGNILTIGTRPDGEKWRIGIQKPFAGRGETAEVVEIADQTVVSSGTYERYFEKDGKLYHHILDPDTGYPADTDIQSISVICDSSLMGDAVSTTCLALGSQKAEELIRGLEGVRAVMILEDGETIHVEKDGDGGTAHTAGSEDE